MTARPPNNWDRVIDRWQRMLSGVDSRTRLYFYLFRRPSRFADDADGAAVSVAALGRRKRRAFLEERVQEVSAYVAWDSRSASIRRHHAKVGRAVVDGLCKELDGAAAEPA